MNSPVPVGEIERLAALQSLNILDTLPEEEFDDVVRLASFICGTPIGAISLIDERRQWFKSVLGLGISETPRDIAFCAHTILQPGLLVVPDAKIDERFEDNPLVTGDPGIRFYAGVPLITSAGQALGSLCVIDRVPRTLTSDQVNALRTLSRHVVAKFERVLHAAAQKQMLTQIAKSEDKLRETEARFRTSLGALDEGLVIQDDNGSILYCNSSAERILMRSVGKMSEQSNPFDSTWRIVRDDGTDFPDAQHPATVALREGKPQHDIIMGIDKRDGFIHWISVNAIPFLETTASPSPDGHSCLETGGERSVRRQAVVTFTDITKRRQSEEALKISSERFKLAIGALHDGFVVQNQRGEIEVCNGRAEEILGLSADQMAGRTSLDPRWRAIHEDGSDWPGDTHPSMIGLNDGIPQHNAVMGVHKPDGTLTWLNINVEPLFHPGQSKAHAVVVSFTDITDRRRLESEQMRMTQEAIERADRDPLTNLYNHRTFHHRLRVEAERIQSYGGDTDSERAEGMTNRILAVIVADMDNFKFFNDTYGHLVGDEVLCAVAGTLQSTCRKNDTLARIGGDEFAILLPCVTRGDAMECAARIRRTLRGLKYQAPGEEKAVPLRLSVGMAILPDETSSYNEAVYIADKRAMQDKSGDINQSASDTLRASLRDAVDGFAMLDALVMAVDNKDRYTRQHSEDVMRLCRLIGHELSLSDDTLSSLEIAALLHDVGKIGVSIRLLRQPGPLSQTEFDAVRQHPGLGAILVSAVPELSHTLGAVRHHHERWDGRGYPDGLEGERIPLEARIMAVADAYSAMTTDRPYRVGMTPGEAMNRLNDGAGTQFDPRCVAAFSLVYESVESSESTPSP